MSDQATLPLDPGPKPLEPGHYWLQVITNGSFEVGEWTGEQWWLQGDEIFRSMKDVVESWIIGPRIAEPDPIDLVLEALA